MKGKENVNVYTNNALILNDKIFIYIDFTIINIVNRMYIYVLLSKKASK